ncbi:hypothetical protein HP532_23495 [Pseudomonas sp. CrR25]|nr:hypothetical protein [Pseudomonas sp. CrR25]
MSAIQGRYLALLLLASSTIGAAEPAQQYQRLRSQAALLTVNAMIYFDADPRARPDARHLTALREAQQYLDALAVRLDPPAAIGDSLASLNAWLDSLRALPREEAARYPRLLIGLLDSQAHLDREVGQAYQQTQDQLPAQEQLLNRQSLAISSLLLHTQARSARVLGEHSLAHTEAEFAARAAAIEQGFDELLKALPDQADMLNKQRLAYRFVRQRLLDLDPGQATAGAERYLTGVVIALDEMAMH